jgi:methionyl-tRNA formyltransferase
MRIVFAGTPEFAAAALGALHQAGHEIALVLTQPDRPAGRGLQPAPPAVKRLAVELGLEVRQPATLKTPEAAGLIAQAHPEVMVVAAYGLILPAAVLRIPPRGCLNIHASLLPRWRGAAPIQRALLAGDRETGISIMQMDEGLDTGPVLLQEALPVTDDDTAQSLHDRLAALGARLIVRALDAPRSPVPQDSARATYAAKIDKSEARIDWMQDAATIHRQVRAFNPVPGAWTTYRGAPLKLWRAAVARPVTDKPGTVRGTAGGAIYVACGAGTGLDLLEVQRAGAKRLSAAAFLAGSALAVGDRLGD